MPPRVGCSAPVSQPAHPTAQAGIGRQPDKCSPDGLRSSIDEEAGFTVDDKVLETIHARPDNGQAACRSLVRDQRVGLVLRRIDQEIGALTVALDVASLAE